MLQEEMCKKVIFLTENGKNKAPKRISGALCVRAYIVAVRKVALPKM